MIDRKAVNNLKKVLMMKSILTLALLLFFATTSAIAGIPGVKGPYIDVIDGKVQLQLNFAHLSLPVYPGFYIPKLPNSSALVEPNAMEGGTLVTVRLALEDIKIVKAVVTENAYVLPDGRPIPGVAGGKIKNGLRLDLKERNHKLSFYYHEKIFGFYVPLNVKYDFPINAAAISLSWKGKPVGSLHLVAPEKDKKAAMVVFLRLKDIEENTEMMEALTKSIRPQ